MNNKKTILIAAVALLVLAGILAGIWYANRPQTDDGTKTITVEVLHGDGSTKSFTYTTSAEYLGEVILAEGLVQGEEGEYGLYILTVDGEDAVYEDDGAYWALYQNGEYATSGADTTPIQDGDVFRFEYTK